MADYADGALPRKREPKGDLKKRHQTALAEFHVSASSFSKQRTREVEDLKFVDFDEQWPEDVKRQRGFQGPGADGQYGTPATGARPTLTINTLRGPCQQVASMRRNARLALQFSPKGNGATSDIASAYEDIARSIQQESRASIARNWAADRSEKAGLGWYRIDCEYAIDKPDDPAAWNDQDIVYRRILNQASVYPDPRAQEPDFCDGRRLFVTEDLRWKDYKTEYPDSDLADCDNAELSGIGDQTMNDWVFTSQPEGDPDAGRTVRIAEYWEVVETRRTRVELSNGESAYDGDQLPSGVSVVKGGRKRVVTDRKIYWSKINAIEYLEGPMLWDGAYIPIIPSIGEEQNINGDRRWQGIVRPAKDAAFSYSVMRSSVIETIGLATKAPFIGYFETIEPFLNWWKQSNVRNFFMLPIKAVRDAAGNFLPPPQRQVDEPAIQATAAAAAMARDDVHVTTGVPPVALGQLDPNNRSGKAIEALQGQAETGSSGYLDNLAYISMAYEGKVLRDLIPRKYDRPKRIVPAVADDETKRLVMLNWPYTDGPDGPVAVEGWTPGAPVPEGAEYLDLSKGVYTVAVSVGTSYATKRKQASTEIRELMGAVPPEMAAFLAPAWIEELDVPGAKKIAAIAKKSSPQIAAAYQESDGTGPSVEQVQQENQQLKAALQEMQAAAEDNKTKLAIAAGADAAKLESAKIKAQTDLAVAEIKAMSQDQALRIRQLEVLIGVEQEARLERMSAHKHATEHAHDAATSHADRVHEREMAAAEHERAIEAGQIAHEQGLEAGQAAHEQGIEAAQVPPPVDPNKQSAQNTDK